MGTRLSNVHYKKHDPIPEDDDDGYRPAYFVKWTPVTMIRQGTNEFIMAEQAVIVDIKDFTVKVIGIEEMRVNKKVFLEENKFKDFK